MRNEFKTKQILGAILRCWLPLPRGNDSITNSSPPPAVQQSRQRLRGYASHNVIDKSIVDCCFPGRLFILSPLRTPRNRCTSCTLRICMAKFVDGELPRDKRIRRLWNAIFGHCLAQYCIYAWIIVDKTYLFLFIGINLLFGVHGVDQE